MGWAAGVSPFLPDEAMNDVKLPETVEEFQKALRVAFTMGAHWEQRDRHSFTVSADDEARRRYPITRRVPRAWVDRTAGGVRWFVKPNGNIGYGHPDELIEPGTTLTPERIRGWADLIANPSEEIEE